MNTESVLFLTYWYPNKSNKSFGIFVKRHAHAIALSNTIVVLSFNIKPGRSFFKKSSSVHTDERQVETHEVYLTSRFHKLLYVLLPLQQFILKRYIRRHLSGRRFTLLHSNIIFPCAIAGRRLAAWLGVKHVITEHWTKIDKFFGRSLYRHAGKKAYAAANAVSCVSTQLAATIKKHAAPKALHIIPNVIDGKEFYYRPDVRKNEVLTFIAAAHWAQFKNPFYFLNALQSLQQEQLLPEFKVVLAGEGVQLERVKAGGYSFKIDYKGNLGPEVLSLELNKSHIFLHGSEFETFSVIIAEALMCGLPAVVSPVGIGPEAVHAGNGFVTDNTAESWKAGILACSKITYNSAQIAGELKNKYSQEEVGVLFNRLYSGINS